MNKYLISFTGVQGSGKSTQVALFQEKHNFEEPPSRKLYPLRMVNYSGLIIYLENYYNTLVNYFLSANNENIITSRFGLLDVLINMEAQLQIGNINQNERSMLLTKCKYLFDSFKYPSYLINIYAQEKTLLNRLKYRDKMVNQNIERNITDLTKINNMYKRNFIEKNYSNKLIKLILENKILQSNILVINTTHLSASEVFMEITNKLNGF